jgi:hypothetical protein
MHLVFSHSFASHQVADWKCVLWDVPRLTLSSKNYLLGKTSFIYISERNYWPGRNIRGVEDVKSSSLAQVVRSKMYLTFPQVEWIKWSTELQKDWKIGQLFIYSGKSVS